MAESSKQNGIRVLLLPVGKPDRNGVVHSYRSLQEVIDGHVMRRITNKEMYGELQPPKADVGPVRMSEVALEQACLRLASLSLLPHSLIGTVIPAGPRKDEFEAAIAGYRQPIPLAMRALMSADGKIEHIVSFDFCASMLQGVPKMFDDPPSHIAEPPRMGGTMAENSDLNRQPIGMTFGDPVQDAEVTDAALAMIAKATQPARKKYVKPELKTITQAEHDAAVAKVGKKAAKKRSSRGNDGVNIPVDESPFVRRSEQEIVAQNQADFDVYHAGLQDPDVKEVVGCYARALLPSNDGMCGICFFDPPSLEHLIFRSAQTGDLAYYTQPASIDMSPSKSWNFSGTVSIDPNIIQNALGAFQRFLSTRADDYVQVPQEIPTVPTPATTVAKKPTAKAVFKAIEPIVSKNVDAHFDQVFRVNKNMKFDGYQKKLNGKAGAFVRLEGNPDIFALPYTIKSAKSSAAERSLRDALATRKIEIVDVGDLKP